MRKIVALIAVTVSLVAASPAMAAFLPLGVAHHRSMNFARGICNEFRSCRYYGLVRCVRVSGSRVDCKVFQEHQQRSGHRATCTTWLDWTLSPGGRLTDHDELAHCVTGWIY